MQVPNLSGATCIVAGYYHTLALKGDGTVWWGDNVAGSLGDGTTENRNTPVKVKDLIGLTAIATTAGITWRSNPPGRRSTALFKPGATTSRAS